MVRELQSGPSKAAPRNGAGERRIRVTPVQKEMSKERSLRRERRCRTPRSVTDPQLLMSTSTRSGQPRDGEGDGSVLSAIWMSMSSVRPV